MIMAKDPIRVVIIEDHPGVRAGIKRLLVAANDIVVIGEGENGKEALELAHTVTPDILLLDVELPELRGDEVARIIRDTETDVKILAVSSYNDRMHVRGMMENGASGYITKDEAPELLVEAVRSVYEGQSTWMSPRALKYAPVHKADGSSQDGTGSR
jgi:DNA-binding NarL/FixJ family response regulator